jgi:signal transduction histidine kinase/ActR/RegA family two-component response regulator
MDPDGSDLEQRLLILAPTTRDASLSTMILERARVAARACSNLDRVCDELALGAGAVLLVEEAVVEPRTRLTDWLRQQPPWSDLPILVLARPGADSAAVAQAMEILGNVIVLERPTRVAALVSAVRTALRARQRQYQIRDHLVALERREQELRESSAALRQSQSLELARRVEFETLVAAAPAAIWVAHDRKCHRITGNPAAARMLRVPAEANVSKTAPPGEGPEHVEFYRGGQRVPPEDLPMQTAARTGQPVVGQELEFRFRDGNSTWAYGNAAPLFDAAGEVRGVISSFLDITALKRIEEELHEADRRKDEFLAVLAHELRNPLAPIRSSLHILRLSGRKDRTAEQVSEMMARQVNHMVRLVDDLLEVSRITRGKIELRREPIDLADAVHGALEISRPLIEEAGHHLRVELPREPLPVDGDSVRLAQVFANLLNNAAKYTDRGGHIRLSVVREGEEVTIAVRDSGIGIPPAMLPRVFDLFTQIDQQSSRTRGGLGIGLMLVKRLVEMHGGTITAHSDGPDQGSEFVVRLPLSAVPRRQSSARPEVRMAASPTQRVLVVDDNRDAADSLGLLLKILGANVQVVHSGQDALAVLKDFRPTVCLLDIGMPGMDGYEVAHRIRRQPGFRHVTLIALTGWGQDEDRRHSQSAGFDYHLTKPADIDALQVLLSSLGAEPNPGGARDRGGA